MAAGQITVDLLLRTGSFETDTKRAAANLRKLEKEAVAIGKAFGVAFTSAAIGLGYLVKSSIDAQDNLNDLAKKTGVAVETLGGIGFAASQAGGDLESTAAGLGKLNKTIAEAAAGNKDAAEFFQVLGIAVRDSAGKIKDAGTIYLEVADKFAAFEDGPNKAALALRGFGKAGLDQIPVLNEGAAALQENIDYYKRYSGVTAESAKRADEFNGTQTKLGLLMSAFGNVLAAEALPLLKTLADRFLKAKEEGDGFQTGAEGITSVLKGLVVAGAYVVDTFGGIGREIGALAAQSRILQDAFSGASLLEKASPILMAKRLAEAFNSNQFTSISDAVREDGERAKQELDAFVAKVLNSSGKLDLSGFAKTAASFGGGGGGKTGAPGLAGDGQKAKKFKSGGEQDAHVKAFIEAMKEQAEVVLSASRVYDDFLQKQIRFTDSLQDEADAAKEQAAIYGLTTDELHAYNREKLLAAALALELKANAEGEAASTEAVARQYRDQAAALRARAGAEDELRKKQADFENNPLTGADQAVKDYLDSIKKAGLATYDVVGNALQGLEDLAVDALMGGNIKKAAKSLVNQLIAEFYRLQIVKPLLNSIMGGGGLSALAGLFGGGSTGSSVGYGIPSGVPMATGTNRVPYDGFKAILHKDEAVVPAKYNPAAGGGETSVTIVNNTGAGVREERSESGGKKMVRIIIGEVARDMARGGSTRQAAREAIGPRQRRG
jgi:hypothetical protein